MPTYSTDPTLFDVALNLAGDVKAVLPLMELRPDTLYIGTAGITDTPTAAEIATTPYINKAVLRDYARRQITVHTGYKDLPVPTGGGSSGGSGSAGGDGSTT